MRCPNCNKFVPYDDSVDPEEESSPECDETTFTASFRRVLTCEECGEELKETTIEIEYDFASDIGKDESEDESKKTGDPKAGIAGHVHNWSVEDCDASASTSSDPKPGRLGKHATLYGVECEVEIKCECGATATFHCDAYERASNFEELV